MKGAQMKKLLLPLGVMMAVAAILVAVVVRGDGSAPATDTSQTTPRAEEVRRQTVTVRADGSGVTADEDHLAPGFVTVRLEPHEGDHSMQFLRLEDGVNLDQVIEAMASDDFEAVTDISELLGGFVAPSEDQIYDLTIDLEPGTYGLVDFGGERKPNFLKGFVTSFVVDDTERHPASAPEAVATIALEDFAIDSPEVLTPGTILVQNVGATVHELNFMRFDEGKGIDDFDAYVESQGRGRPPGEEVTGIATTEPGVSLYVDLPFEPGDYIAACFTADKHNPPHVALGMYGGFSVN
jgi:hypothetical protein